MGGGEGDGAAWEKMGEGTAYRASLVGVLLVGKRIEGGAWGLGRGEGGGRGSEFRVHSSIQQQQTD